MFDNIFAPLFRTNLKNYMARIKYYYDTETCRYERVKTTKSDVIFNILGFLAVSALFAVGLTMLYVYLFPSEKERLLAQENRELLLKYQLLDQELKSASVMMQELQERDNKLYRAIFEADPIPMEMRKGGTGGAKRYQELLSEGLFNQNLIIGTAQKIDQLKRQMYIQTKSYDELVTLAQNKAQMLAAIPAIQPVQKKHLTSFASGFGMRTHPIYKVKKMHTGCDLAAPTGTPVYATGDGVVISAGWHSGYGQSIEIDHGYGYVTRYAHLSKIDVKRGAKIKRGHLIGKVGSTGLSVSPHLHYEVLHNGKFVNPVNYFFNDLTPQEFNELLEISSREGQSLGGGH